MFYDLKYAYLVGDFILFLIWLFFFLRRKDLRKEMLIISLFSAPIGLTQYFFRADYWQPTYAFSNTIIGLEDILYMFFTGGIIGVIYEEIFGKRLSQRHTRSHPYLMLLFSVLGLVSLYLGVMILNLNSIYVSSVIFMIIGLITILIRHDLLWDALYSGVCVCVLTFFVELIFMALFPNIFESWWLLQNISGIFILGIPVEELLFASTLGFIAGPMYEFVFGLRLKR